MLLKVTPNETSNHYNLRMFVCVSFDNNDVPDGSSGGNGSEGNNRINGKSIELKQFLNRINWRLSRLQKWRKKINQIKFHSSFDALEQMNIEMDRIQIWHDIKMWLKAIYVRLNWKFLMRNKIIEMNSCKCHKKLYYNTEQHNLSLFITQLCFYILF